MHRFTNIQYTLFSLGMKKKELSLKSRHDSFFPYQLIEGTLERRSINYVSLGFSQNYKAFDYFQYDQCINYYAQRPIDTVIESIKALVYWNSSQERATYMQMVEKILKRGESLDGKIVFPLFNDTPRYDMPPNFVSGIAQGKVASVLIRAYIYSNDEKYLDACKSVLSAYKIPIEQGGAYRKINGYEWVEEYPDKKKPSMVLNGHLFALIGLGEYLSLVEDAALKKLYSSLLESTLTFMPHYVRGNYLLYELGRWKLCNIHYLGIMTFLFDHIYQLTGIEDFRHMREFTKTKCNWKVFDFLLNNP